MDIGFSQDMIVHHEQAVVMAQLVRDRTQNPRLAALATGIVDEQLLDVGAMRGYLALWQAPLLPAGPPMTWMASGHEHHVGGLAMLDDAAANAAPRRPQPCRAHRLPPERGDADDPGAL